MSSVVKIYPRLITTWEIYPRVQYFQSRFTDFLARFKRVIGALPENVQDKLLMGDLESLKEVFTKKLTILILGEEDLDPGDLFFASYDGKVEATIATQFTVVIFYLKIEQLDENSIKTVLFLIQEYDSRKYSTFPGLSRPMFILCETTMEHDECAKTKFREDLMDQISDVVFKHIPEDQIIITQNKGDIKNAISLKIETRIVHTLLNIRYYLSIFIKENRQQSKVDDQVSESIKVSLTSYISNGLSLSDILLLHQESDSFINKLVRHLVNAIKCMVISPLTSKHLLTPAICNALLCASEFEENLIKSISQRTRVGLGKLESFTYYCKRVAIEPVHKHVIRKVHVRYTLPSRCRVFDHLTMCLLEDFSGAMKTTEDNLSKMGKLANVIKKLRFEIGGYLKQTTVDVSGALTTDPKVTIPESLRNNILR